MASSASSVQMQATFTLESVVDGKQRFSLENLYIILPETIQCNQMEFSFKQASETVSTPVKPIQTVIPSAPVKEPSSAFSSVDNNMPQRIDSEPYLRANRKLNLNPTPATHNEITTEPLGLFHNCAMKREVSITPNDKYGQGIILRTYCTSLDNPLKLFQNCAMKREVFITPNDKYGQGINYNNFLKFRTYCTSLDKPLNDQINDYLYSEYAVPSISVPAEREDWHRLCLLRSLFDKNRFQWQHSYFALYKEWSAKYDTPIGSNRYKKMMKFLDENRSSFTSF
jgi:hypothetical protein